MCGIAGKYFFKKTQFFSHDLEDMLRVIIHRGPDSEGRFQDERVALGFRRLSIIDVKHGEQPLFNEDKQIVLFTNGEIYNYKDLKKKLEQHGHIFSTHSDCEVIIHLYEEYGSDFVSKLNGMFAFCLYDRKQEVLLVGRDRVGIKPMYYSQLDGVLIFSSEIKAILQAKEVSPTENASILDEYLCFRYLTGSRTFFSGIRKLAPGELLEVRQEGVTLRRYWKPSLGKSSLTVNGLVTLIAEKMHDSVYRQLMADVPVGTQLSGGVDSSWVSIIAGKELSGIKSFSVGFDEDGYDETTDAKIVAETGAFEYHEVLSKAHEFSKILPKIIWFNDEPLTHANSVEIYNLCCYARDHVKVLLTGEGADELFGGYPRYNLCRLGEYYNHVPSLLQPVLLRGFDFLARKKSKRPSAFLGMAPSDLVFWNAAFTNPKKVAWLMDKQNLDLESRKEVLEASWKGAENILYNLLSFEFNSYLQPILSRQDKMSMAASIESRVPVLDNIMLDLAFSIAARQKMKYFQPKYLFKRAAALDLPRKIVYKRKIGFGVPTGSWMKNNGPLTEGLNVLLDERRSIPGANPEKIEQAVREHINGDANHEDILWALLNYVHWKNIFFR